MLEISNIKDNVLKCVKQHISMFKNFDHVYLFGSILKANTAPNDIDVLLIYTDYSDKISTACCAIRSILEEEIGLPVDLTVLSSNEERNTGFLKRIQPLCLKLK